MEHVKDEADALADRHEADHHRQHRRQQTDDLGQNAIEHGASNDAGKLGGRSTRILHD